MHQFRKRREALGTLRRVFSQSDHCLVVHYSCESFADRPQGRSPRVTSIAVRSLKSGHTVSFSIHQVAERRRVEYQDIPAQYDSLELEMLREFYEHLEKHTKFTWLPWNMRDINFGFPALAHRYRVLGGTPPDDPSDLVDLSRLFVALYGVGYMKHPRLENLVDANDITRLNMVTGAEEAAAFENREYFKLHQSTLRKVDNIANLADRAANSALLKLTNASVASLPPLFAA